MNNIKDTFTICRAMANYVLLGDLKTGFLAQLDQIERDLALAELASKPADRAGCPAPPAPAIPQPEIGNRENPHESLINRMISAKVSLSEVGLSAPATMLNLGVCAIRQLVDERDAAYMEGVNYAIYETWKESNLPITTQDIRDNASWSDDMKCTEFAKRIMDYINLVCTTNNQQDDDTEARREVLPNG